MSGTVEGGKKAGLTNRQRYGDNYYAIQGSKGGKRSRTGGFASKKVGADGLTGAERARQVGVIGGQRSRRGKAKANV